MQNKVIDRKTMSEVGEYGVGLSLRLKNNDQDYEHAFIVLYYSDPAGQRTVRRAAGFYPGAGFEGYDLLLGGPGKVWDDSRENIATQLIVLVNKGAFEQILAYENRYQDGHTYQLLFNDCTTFVADVAGSISGLDIPSRTLHPLPSQFIQALYDNND